MTPKRKSRILAGCQETGEKDIEIPILSAIKANRMKMKGNRDMKKAAWRFQAEKLAVAFRVGWPTRAAQVQAIPAISSTSRLACSTTFIIRHNIFLESRGNA